MQGNNGGKTNYTRFFAMIATSVVVMFVLMYVNSYEVIGHARLSVMRMYMVVIMGASMTAIMLGYMFSMYKNKKANVAILVGAVLILASAIWLMRSQAMIGDVEYMAGMIPHHSIAILTSDRATLDDLRVQKLAEEIIAAQRAEIAEMEWLLQDIRDNGVVRTEQEATDRAVPEFSP